MLLGADVVTLSWPEALLRLVLAAVLGGAVGIERELREREAGLRTHMMVSLGAALFTLTSAYGFTDFVAANGNLYRIDPTRIAAQIVSGIGFLGAGAIIRQGLAVRGLTTAATLWVVAAIGLASGAGYYAAAVMTTVVVVAALWPLRILAYRMVSRVRPEQERLLVALPAGSSPGELVSGVESAGGRIESLQINQEGDRRYVELDVELPRTADRAKLVSSIAELEGVLEVRWAD
jgi:putative Mg2+ transporter-C (MgtC) family protein